jgi:hypothetical protein
MKNPERPAWMAPSRRAAQPAAHPQTPVRPRHPAHTLQLGSPPVARPEARRGARGSSRGYNPYDTVTTRLPDVWHSKPKRA